MIDENTEDHVSAAADNCMSSGALEASQLAATSTLTPSVFLRMRSYEDLDRFSKGKNGQASPAERAALLRYMSDYLFLARDPLGVTPQRDDDAKRIFGVWVPGCADNDANADERANVEDRLAPPEIIMKGNPPEPTPTLFMGMYATRDISAGEMLLSDYDGAYGTPPQWMEKFA